MIIFSVIIFSGACDKFLKDLENRTKITKGYASNKTRETYGRILNKLGEYLNKGKPHTLDLEKITADEIIFFLAEAREFWGILGTSYLSFGN